MKPDCRRPCSRLLLLAAPILLLQGCSWFAGGLFDGDRGLQVGATIGQLQVTSPLEAAIPVARLSLEEVEATYRKALQVAVDPQLRQKIMIRLADLEMRRAEEAMLEETELGEAESGETELSETELSEAGPGETGLNAELTPTAAEGQYFDRAATLYQDLLEDLPPQSAPASQRDVLLYQLAKAYALDGRMEQSAAALDKIAEQHPQSLFSVEAEFRRAERAFSNRQYASAEASYAAVIAAGSATPFYDNALYMQGWSRFKQNHLRSSLQAFTHMLDKLLQDSSGDKPADAHQITLFKDTLRVMGLAFSYMNGAQSIADTYQELGDRPWLHLLYRQLSELYLEKQRYRDSADSYQYFVEHYPLSDHAPDFSVAAIEVYLRGNYPTLVLPAKEQYVRRYGIHSDYWGQKDVSLRQSLLPYLRAYLRELAQYQHAAAQAQKARASKLRDAAVASQALIEANAHFLAAADWYQQFVNTFPSDPELAEVLFLMAEARFEAGDYAGAYLTYQRVAYDLPAYELPAYKLPAYELPAREQEHKQEQKTDSKRGAEAGYSAILALDMHLQSLPAEEDASIWQRRRIDTALRFADHYGKDDRAAPVLAQAAQLLLQAGEPQQAIAAATRLTNWHSPVDGEFRRNAFLVAGQSQFDLQQYARAEQAYQQALALMPVASAARDAVVERIAASIYQHAAAQLAQGDVPVSIQQLLRIRDVAPQSDIAITAQFDAINQMMAAQLWPRAQREALDFRARHRQHELTATLPAKLVVIYEEQQDWGAAAAELLLVSAASDQPEVRRKSLFLAADYLQQAGDVSGAIVHFRDYAHTYPQPFEQGMEACWRMSQLYVITAEPGKRRYWLRKMIAADAAAGKLRTDRSRYLAAFASADLADESFQAFSRIPLRLPLKTSLQKKKKALQKTLAAYQQVQDYGVSEFTTLSGFRIGEIYARLSRDLLQSQRPKNLPADALEQYDMLLEEQAYPFEEQAIAIHQNNARLGWQGHYDQWVQASLDALATMMPARYAKRERVPEFSDAIY